MKKKRERGERGESRKKARGGKRQEARGRKRRNLRVLRCWQEERRKDQWKRCLLASNWCAVSRGGGEDRRAPASRMPYVSRGVRGLWVAIATERIERRRGCQVKVLDAKYKFSLLVSEPAGYTRVEPCFSLVCWKDQYLVSWGPLLYSSPPPPPPPIPLPPGHHVSSQDPHVQPGQDGVQADPRQ